MFEMSIMKGSLVDRKQKAAIVTGGGSGLGFAIAARFIENNIHTVILGRDAGKLKTACRKLADFCDYVQFDLFNREQIPDVVARIIDDHGHIDIPVNNAGIHQKKSLFEVSDEAVYITGIVLPVDGGNSIGF